MNNTLGHHNTYTYSITGGSRYNINVSGSTQAVLYGNNKKEVVDHFLSEDLPRYYYQISKYDPLTTGVNTSTVTTYDPLFNKNVEIYKDNLENFINTTNISNKTSNIESLKSYSEFFSLLERLNEKYLQEISLVNYFKNYKRKSIKEKKK